MHETYLNRMFRTQNLQLTNLCVCFMHNISENEIEIEIEMKMKMKMKL